VEELGANAVNRASEGALKYPAILITHTYEERAVIERLEKEQWQPFPER
jgi:hypothetical protein